MNPIFVLFTKLQSEGESFLQLVTQQITFLVSNYQLRKVLILIIGSKEV